MIDDGPPCSNADRVRGQAPREDRDDREADREVLKSAHAPEELLGIAHPVEKALVARPPRCRSSGTPAWVVIRRPLVAEERLTAAVAALRYLGHSRRTVSRIGAAPPPRGDGIDSRPRPPRERPDADAGRAEERRRRRFDRHGDRRVHRHAGPPDGQAADGGVLHRGERGGARRRGVQLPARARHGDGSEARLPDRKLGAGLRRLRARSRHGDASPHTLARSDCARPLRRRLARRDARLPLRRVRS